MRNGTGIPLLGREGECGRLDRLVEGVRGGHGGALVLHGEAGIGKTALLDYAAGAAGGLRLIRVRGVETEAGLDFATLHQVCVPLLDRLGGLSAPQQEALRAAFGLACGPPPDRFLAGLATLSLLAEGTRADPLICLIDDSHWLDPASLQALAFAARRLESVAVLLVFATREPVPDLDGLADLRVEGLAGVDSRLLLESEVRSPFDGRVLDRIVAETHGNPLDLLHQVRGRSPGQLAGGFGVPARHAPGPVEEGYRQLLDSLAAGTRKLLLIAAADLFGDPAVVWRAARSLGIPADATTAAADAGLLQIDFRVRFPHPSARSAAYRLARLNDRHEAHQALARATDPRTDPDGRVWHRAHATSGPDDEVAADLSRAAARAGDRGGLAASAAFLERAAVLTSDPLLRAERALGAADAKLRSGAFDAACDLLRMAEAGPLGELHRVRVDLVRALAAYLSHRGGEVVPALLDAARRLQPVDAEAARVAYLAAFGAARRSERLARPGETARDVAEAAPMPDSDASAAGLLLCGLAAAFTAGPQAAAPLLRQGLAAASTQDGLRWSAGIAAVSLWDDGLWDRLCAGYVASARQAGLLSELPLGLGARIYLDLLSGSLAAAGSMVDELAGVLRVTGSRLPPYGAVALAAFRGDEEATGELAENIQTDVRRRGEGIGITATEWAKAVLYNGLGRYEEARVAAAIAAEPAEPGLASWALAELVEAAARTGAMDEARAGLEHLDRMTGAAGTDWGLGVHARCAAMVLDGDRAEHRYREAIDRLMRTRLRTEAARSHLVYGEWLRRESRRVDARDHLHTAYEMLAEMGLDAYAERARRELLATGESVRKRRVDTTSALTAQEAEIARLARDGLSNPEISTQLFISARTVEWHLRKVFAKLDITSRRHLRHVLP